MIGKTALLVGATGLVGKELATILLRQPEYNKVIIIGRSSIGITHPKLEEKVIDFEHLDTELINVPVDDVFSCLGTTIKKARSKELMYKIDVTYPLKIAKLSKKVGAKHFLFVSAPYANASSSIFYTRIKGQLENEIDQLDFKTISVFRPSLLLGKRQEVRLGEKTAEMIFSLLPFLFIGPLKPFRAIQGKTVAQAMVNAAQLDQNGKHIYSLDQIEDLAHRKTK